MSDHQFHDILKRGECSEYEYQHYEEEFDAAVKAGQITIPVRHESPSITHGTSTDIRRKYSWKIFD